jgi:hypothetical protein
VVAWGPAASGKECGDGTFDDNMKRESWKDFGLTLLALAVILGVMFSRSFTPEMMLFANDGPLGAISAASGDMRYAWSGVWQDLNWLGIENPAALPHTTSLFWFVLGNSPVNALKFQTPIALMGLGLSLWVLLRQFGFRQSVCALAAIAAALNMNSFSHSTWGLPSRSWTMASSFLALAALRGGLNGRPILKALLAGMAVANGIMEGFDVGAIYSLYVGAFAVFVVLAQANGAIGTKLTKGVGHAVVVAVFAGICSAAALSTLIGTQIQGITGMGQDAAEKEKRWDGATMWSLPKMETARVLVPGLFGYRMDADAGGNYWGAVGQVPGDPKSRHSGAGEYAGALVVVLAAFGIANAFRKKGNPYTDFERKTVLFFTGAAVISVLLAWGRHAPFYKIVYALPYFSTIRNPIKFMHPFHLSLLISFGFGLEALFRLYLKDAAGKVDGLKQSIARWWGTAAVFERRWVYGTVAFVAAGLVSFLIYSSSRPNLLAFLEKAGFQAPMNEQIANFSYGEAGYALVFVALAVALVLCAMSGWFSGPRAKLFVIIAGAFLALDLMRADYHWVVYYNYKERYASNPVIDFLKEKSYEHRATARVVAFSQDPRHHLIDNQTSMFANVANSWLQHLFQYYNIQALEPVQFPRPPELDQNFFQTLLPAGANRPPSVLMRMWELTNTRYLIGSRQRLSTIGQELGGPALKILFAFDMTPKPGVSGEQLTIDDVNWVRNDNGRFAVAEYAEVLPRAKLFGTWQVMTNSTETLDRLASKEFDPHASVLLSEAPPLTPGGGTNFAGEVKIAKYAPKHIELTASNNAPAILLYTDKYSPNWRVWVDGKEEKLLRANYIMRGIALAPGDHRIEMKYAQPTTGLKVSAVGFGCGLLAFAAVCLLPGSRKAPLEPSVVQLGSKNSSK